MSHGIAVKAITARCLVPWASLRVTTTSSSEPLIMKGSRTYGKMELSETGPLKDPLKDVQFVAAVAGGHMTLS